MKPKKELGQHFLKNEHYAQRIASYAINHSDGKLLEIGPGKGFLSQFLLASVSEFKMVEYDPDMADHLKAEFDLKADQLILGDFLTIDLDSIFTGCNFDIVGNFPYNISSQIVFKVLDCHHRVRSVTGMFQKEVALRIASQHGTKQYGILSVLTQVYYQVHILFHIKPGNFNPPPKVDSTVIALHRREHPLIEDEMKDIFYRIVKAAFGQRRKMLRNSIKSWLSSTNIPLLEKYLTLRPEQLSVSDFVSLTQIIYHKK